jgi:RNA recognition motif-containing protein
MGIEVYVGHLSPTSTEDELRKLFAVAGTVSSVHLVRNSGSGELRGCAYVRMSTEDEACDAIGLLNGAMLGDQLIVVRDVTKQNSGTPRSSGGNRGNRPPGKQ